MTATRQIEIGLDVFASIWAARQPEEMNEDQILRRILIGTPRRKRGFSQGNIINESISLEYFKTILDESRRPKSKRWTDVLIWSLQELGGKAHLSMIYNKSREARRLLGVRITREHDASARECLESHCRDSLKFRFKADLFYMPEGKGSGVWAIR